VQFLQRGVRASVRAVGGESFRGRGQRWRRPCSPGPVHGPGERGEQVGVCRSDVAGGSVLVQEISDGARLWRAL